MNTRQNRHSDQIYADHQQQVYGQTDRMFAVLMIIQWIAGIAAALIISPRTWIGQTSHVHLHVWAAAFLGGVISLVPIALAFLRPGHVSTRYTIAVGQMLMSSLLIHLTGGRIETHFHVFGSLAFLSFYRDWRVLVPATIVVALDHMLRGIFYPQSVFGVLTAENWRWVEHAGWVIFEDIFLVLSCLRGQAEMRQIADDTAKLDASEARYRSVTDSTSEAIITLDDKGIILFANRSAEDIFGYYPDELQGRDARRLVPGKMGRRHAALLKRLATGGPDASNHVSEVTAVHKGGSEFLTETSFAVYDSETGRIFTAVVRDITERKSAEAALKRSEEYRNLFQHANDPILIFEPEGEVILDVNEKACEVYGIPRDEFIGISLKTLTRDVERGERHIADVLENGSCQSYESVNFRADGTPIDFLINASVIEHGGRPAIMTINRDVSERKKAKDDLENNLSLLTSTFQATADGILAVDLENNIITANKQFVEMWDIPREYENLSVANQRVARHMLGQVKNPEDLKILIRRSLKNPGEISVGTLELTNGRILERYTQPQIVDGTIVGRVMSFRDITERKRAENQLLHDALHDGLTGLANRTLFMDHLRLAIERRTSKNSNPFAVLYLDFDRFKVVNDSLGHPEGDKLLKYIARRLKNSTRTGDLVARLGGDEFVILVSELECIDEALMVAERIQTDLREPFDLSGREIFTTVSIGITLSTSGHTCADNMLRDADIAMYSAKAKGKAQYQVFDAAMHKYASRKLQIETEMRTAIEQGEFRIYYQPIVEVSTERLVGFESLIRWEHPERGVIGPDEFIPIAEESGMIISLGRWTVEESCRQMRRWQDTEPGAADLTVSVNLSCKEFVEENLAENIASALTTTGLDARSLKLEITESHIMENSELAINILNRLRVLGVEMSLDDFGTGYSSLSYLHRLPVTFLKIDRSFVSRMVGGDENGEIVNTIIRLAQNLNMKVIAEGIETSEQAAVLAMFGCEFGQGYYYARPLDPEAALEYLRRQGPGTRVPAADSGQWAVSSGQLTVRSRL